MIREDCKHIIEHPGDWSEFWGAMVQHPSIIECKLERDEFFEDRCEECPEYYMEVKKDERDNY